MKVVITMAGAGSRFRKAGYNQPKHEIEVNGKSLFEWSMSSLEDLFYEDFIFIVRQGFYNKQNLEQLINKIGIKTYQIHELSELTSGQASTVMSAASLINDNDEIAIYNIDTYIEPMNILKADMTNCDGHITVFNAPGDHWSFVAIDDSGNVTDVVEKKRISDYASVGFYYFAKFADFKNVYEKYSEQIIADYSEVYIAPMYHYLLEQNKQITIKLIPYESVHALGTPVELESFKERY